MSTRNNDQPEATRRRSQAMIWTVSFVVVLAVLGAFGSGVVMRNMWVLTGIVIAFVGIFPLTYIAYLAFRAPAQRDRLKNDFRLLGLASTSDLDDVVEKQYNTVYSPVQFIVFIVLIVVFCILMGSTFLVKQDSQLLKETPTLANLQDTPMYSIGRWLWNAAKGDEGEDNTQAAGAAAVGAMEDREEEGEANALAAASSQAPSETDNEADPLATAATAGDSDQGEGDGDPGETPFENNLELVFFAFLGAYLFSVQELVRRYNTFDLLPQVYSSIFLRMILATGIVFVGKGLISTTDGGSAIWAVIAFLIGFFPQRGIDWLAGQTGDVFKKQSMSLQSARPLSQIIGISPWHEARLAQLGIDDAQNLAMADIRKLLLTTQFDTQEIVNWIDQAILYIKVGDDTMTELRGKYINTFFELDTALGPKRDQDADILAALNSGDLSALVKRVMDSTNYPNYAHILEYYVRSAIVVQHYAEEGAEIILGSQLPYLATDIQDGDDDEIDADRKDLEKSIERLSRLAGDSAVDAKLWMALGVQKQALARSLAQNDCTADGGAEVAGLQKESGEALDRAIELSPSFVESYVRRAAYTLEQVAQSRDTEESDTNSSARLEAAIKDCTKALELDPARAIAFHYRALAHVQQGDNLLARQDFERAVQTDDRLAVAYMNRGTLHNSLGEFAQATSDFQAAYYCGFSKPTLFANWGKALLGLEDYTAAIEMLSKATAMDPASAMPFADRGYAYYQRRQYDRARHDCSRAVRKNPALVSAHINLGLSAAAQNQHEEAIEAFTAALDIEPHVPSGHYYRGLSYQAMGNTEAATDDLKFALAESPNEKARNDVRLALALVLSMDGHGDAADELLVALDSSQAATEGQRRQAEKLLQGSKGTSPVAAQFTAVLGDQQSLADQDSLPAGANKMADQKAKGRYVGGKLQRGGGEWIGDTSYDFDRMSQALTQQAPPDSSTSELETTEQ